MKRILRILFILMAFMAGSSAAPASPGPSQDGARSTAQWITAAGVAERDEVVLHFRKIIELKQAPARFVVEASGDNQFILFVNGREAGRGPSRADLAHWRFEALDIAP
ncbi:MAG TPA: hypothetical protein VKB24_05290, partial [Candidatus Acidoferrum sp.]|nr:hypothetical protein [Candidatus Acidoferrum sp.]